MDHDQEHDSSEDLEVIETGMDLEEMSGPEGWCCWGALGPFRW